MSGVAQVGVDMRLMSEHVSSFAGEMQQVVNLLGKLTASSNSSQEQLDQMVAALVSCTSACARWIRTWKPFWSWNAELTPQPDSPNRRLACKRRFFLRCLVAVALPGDFFATKCNSPMLRCTENAHGLKRCCYCNKSDICALMQIKHAPF
jgi:hypothetical protein